MRVLAIVAFTACGVAHADEPRTTPTGFDHMIHDRNLVVSGANELPCSRCHTEHKGKLVGKPGHAACFGSCHGSAPTAPRRGGRLELGDRAKVCTSCHAEAALVRAYTVRPSVAYPPYRIDPDFNIAFGHARHAAVACTQCHDMRARKPTRVAHGRCAGCHDGTSAPGRGPAMNACSGCHPRAIGQPEPPQLAVVRDSVTASFSHARHAARSTAGKDCMSCHAAIQKTDDTQLPRPTMQSCGTASCHDGRAAFATFEACTRCHDRAPERFEVERPTARFRHDGPHAETIGARACITCHAIGPRGDTVVTGHAVCATCHADDFAARRPTKCGACHNATEPWRPLTAGRALPRRTEFGAQLDHAKHPADCARCHSLRTATAQLRPPRGHAACTGEACHAASSGPAPTLAACTACHAAGLAEARRTARLRAPWSVRATFEHALHTSTADGAPLACTACHSDLAGASLLAVPTPNKATCAGCHDGTQSFKLTGTTCSRCHREAPP
jgi:c(7)-type cytochrome triheme protein